VSFDLDFLKKEKYCLPDVRQYTHHLDKIFSSIDDEWSSPSPKISRLTREGYTVYEGPSLRNVLYVNNITDESREGVKLFMVESGTKQNIEELFQSNIGICNIRAYRFTNNPPDNKTHYMDLLDVENTGFNPHLDGLCEGAIKLMVFKSKGEEKMTLQHGALEIRPKNQWIPLIGNSPVVAIFPPNIVLHRAYQPSPGKIRDAVELTIVKRKSDDFLVESSGAHAGYPLDMVLWNNKKINN
jgi:hypothetical protein